MGLLALSGCAPSSGRKTCKVNRFNRQSDELIARVSSIPDTPFFAQIEDFGEDPESMYNLIVRYKFSGEGDNVKDFYHQEMERSGWKVVMKVDASDKIIVFERPDLVAVIEIRPKEQRYTIVLGRKIYS